MPESACVNSVFVQVIVELTLVYVKHKILPLNDTFATGSPLMETCLVALDPRNVPRNLRSFTGLAYHFLRWDASDSAPILPGATGEDAKTDERESGKPEIPHRLMLWRYLQRVASKFPV